ncbi:hypothetical protein AAMO2058_000868300 [Amorphochlora amoebiformis]
MKQFTSNSNLSSDNKILLNRELKDKLQVPHQLKAKLKQIEKQTRMYKSENSYLKKKNIELEGKAKSVKNQNKKLKEAFEKMKKYEETIEHLKVSLKSKNEILKHLQDREATRENNKLSVGGIQHIHIKEELKEAFEQMKKYEETIEHLKVSLKRNMQFQDREASRENIKLSAGGIQHTHIKEEKLDILDGFEVADDDLEPEMSIFARVLADDMRQALIDDGVDGKLVSRYQASILIKAWLKMNEVQDMVVPGLVKALREIHPDNVEIKEHVDKFNNAVLSSAPIMTNRVRWQIMIGSVIVGIHLIIGGSLFEMLERENEVSEAGETGIDNEFWTFTASIFFSLTIVSTIGYGQTAPKTSLGQALVVVYALIGVPIFGFLLSRVSKVVNRFFVWIMDSGLSLVTTSHKEYVYGRSDQCNWFTTLVLSTTLIGGLLLGCIVFDQSEDWTFMESLYFSFVTLSSLGFGDYLPLKSSSRAITAFFIVLFMGSLSEIFSIIEEYFGVIQRKIEKIVRCMFCFSAIGRSTRRNIGRAKSNEKDAKQSLLDSKHMSDRNDKDGMILKSIKGYNKRGRISLGPKRKLLGSEGKAGQLDMKSSLLHCNLNASSKWQPANIQEAWTNVRIGTMVNPMLWVNICGELIYMVEETLDKHNWNRTKILTLLATEAFTGLLLSKQFIPVLTSDLKPIFGDFRRLIINAGLVMSNQEIAQMLNICCVAVKYQLVMCTRASDVLAISSNHLDGVIAILKSCSQKDQRMKLLMTNMQQFYGHLSYYQKKELRAEMLNTLQDINSVIGMLQDVGCQDKDGLILVDHRQQCKVLRMAGEIDTDRKLSRSQRQKSRDKDKREVYLGKNMWRAQFRVNNIRERVSVKSCALSRESRPQSQARSFTDRTDSGCKRDGDSPSDMPILLRAKSTTQSRLSSVASPNQATHPMTMNSKKKASTVEEDSSFIIMSLLAPPRQRGSLVCQSRNWIEGLDSCNKTKLVGSDKEK